MKRVYQITIMACSLILCSASCSKIGKEHEEAMYLEIIDIDFTSLRDGEYTGYYEGGMYRWRENECKVTVTVKKVTGIELLSSQAEYTREFLDTLYHRVIEKQS
ncbi:MAG: FMN-binding protein, partial [Bacteroidota bacterium]|nr:FMN-binding protein [Bacteroidota bacterium]